MSLAVRCVPTGKIQTLSHVDIGSSADDYVRAPICSTKTLLYSLYTVLFTRSVGAVHLVHLKVRPETETNEVTERNNERQFCHYYICAILRFCNQPDAVDGFLAPIQGIMIYVGQNFAQFAAHFIQSNRRRLAIVIKLLVVYGANQRLA